ncbi:lysophospholipid acyltransferase family protein [Parasediminibacterium sp. JCM 36343]|uniref:lysophospholipid acyltransferase family protein n=1 Tax=Parasediminibacterium sp. JCM 36343 TaxID=3374279 RepID=UPI00397B95C2
MYRIVYCFFYLLSLMPWFIIHLISTCIYWVVYHCFGYRKEVVMGNLLIAFPEKTEKERVSIAKESYKQMIDTFLETIKLLSISKTALNKRFQCNYEVINTLYDSGRNVQLHGGHFFNWEFVNLAYSCNLRYPFMGMYLPLSNKIVDKIMYDMRARFGSILISAFNFNRTFLKHSKGRYVLTLGGDQNASNMHHAYWIPFFGKMAPFVTGPERLATAKDTVVFFVNCYRVKRGYYKSELVEYTSEPTKLPPGAITIAFRDFLEKQIRLRPSNYLWTHRRWKHEYKPEEYKNMTLEG